MWKQIKDQPIRFFALLCVMATAAYLAYISNRLVSVLESPTWCGKAIQAERITPGSSFAGLTACVDLLKLQVPILGTTLHIVVGGFVVCLLVLVVIVIARAKGSFALPGGIGGNLSAQDDPVKAAEHVVEGAEHAAAEVKGG